MQFCLTLRKDYDADKAGVQLLYFTPGLGGLSTSPLVKNVPLTFMQPVLFYAPLCVIGGLE